MKRILFLILLISQVVISTEGILFTRSGKSISIEKEATTECDEPEILENRRESITLRQVFLPVSFYTNSLPLFSGAYLIPENQQERQNSLFILHRCIRI